MGVFDPNYKRLALILIMFIYLTCMYTAEAVLLFAENPIDIKGEPSSDFDIDGETESSVRIETEEQGADLFSIIAFLTFVQPELLPAWMLLFLAPITTVTLIVFLYLIIDITYDIIKALPFT